MLIHVPWTMVFAGRYLRAARYYNIHQLWFRNWYRTENGFVNEGSCLSSVFPWIEPHIPPHHRASQPKVERWCFDLGQFGSHYFHQLSNYFHEHQYRCITSSIDSNWRYCWMAFGQVRKQVLVVRCLLFCRKSWLPVAFHLSHGYRHLELASKQESHGRQNFSNYASFVCCWTPNWRRLGDSSGFRVWDRGDLTEMGGACWSVWSHPAEWFSHTISSYARSCVSRITSLWITTLQGCSPEGFGTWGTEPGPCLWSVPGAIPPIRWSQTANSLFVLFRSRLI